MCRSGHDSYVTPCDRQAYFSMRAVSKGLKFHGFRELAYVTPCDWKGRVGTPRFHNSCISSALYRCSYEAPCNWPAHCPGRP
jgi:hypothetical protein